MGLGVTSSSGSLGGIRGAIAGDGVNENVITSRPEATEKCGFRVGVLVTSVVGVSNEEEGSSS
jgi:hypothetical protein